VKGFSWLIIFCLAIGIRLFYKKLLPPSLADWLPGEHLAWFVLDAVEQIDLQPFYKRYRQDGIGNSLFGFY